MGAIFAKRPGAGIQARKAASTAAVIVVMLV
jgi:hypothetical protein